MAARNQLLIILTGASESAVVPPLDHATAISVWIGAPANLSVAVKLQTARPGGLGVWYDQQTNGVDITFTAGKATQVTVLSGVEWRLAAGSAPLQDEIFEVVVNRIVGQPGLP